MAKKKVKIEPIHDVKESLETQFRIQSISRRNFVGCGTALAGSLLFGAGCQSAHPGRNSETAIRKDAAKSTATRVFYLVTHGSSADIFWAAQSKGWLDFCKVYGVDGRYVGTKMDGDVGEMRANLESVLASGSGDGLAIVISNASMLDEPIRRAVEQGTPVVAVNIPDFRPEGQKLPYMRYVGGEPYLTGEANATMTLRAFQTLTGRFPRRSIYLIHVPGIDVLEIRGQGMKETLARNEVPLEKVAVTFDPTQTQEVVRAYLRRHPDVETIHTGSSRVGAWTVKGLKELGRLGNVNRSFNEGNVYVASIDLDPELLGMIVAGDCIGTVDEQPYMQGWYSAQLLYHWVTYRFLPGRDITTGPFVINAKTAELLIDQAKAGLRA